MEKKRSPNYPSLTLREALDRGRKIYDSEHMHPAAKEVMLKDMGFAGANGASLTVFGALRAYGIVQQHGNDFRISSHALTVFEKPDGDPMKTNALRAMAFEPKVFGELRGEFGETMPSEHNLRFGLMQKGFISKAADEVIRVYRENLALVSGLDTGYDENQEEGDTVNQMELQHGKGETAPKLPIASILKPGMRTDVFSLQEGDINIQWPASISAESYQDIEDWLEILKRKIGRSVSKTEA